MLVSDVQGSESVKYSHYLLPWGPPSPYNSTHLGHHRTLRVLKKLKIELPYDQETPLLDIHPEKTITKKDTCTPMLIAALFTVASTQHQPKCLPRDEWIKKMWCLYTMECYSAIKRSKVGSFIVMWMEPQSVIQSEVSQKKKTNKI